MCILMNSYLEEIKKLLLPRTNRKTSDTEQHLNKPKILTHPNYKPKQYLNYNREQYNTSSIFLVKLF